MEDFKIYLKRLGLSDKSILDDMSRINMMGNRGIDFKNEIDHVKSALEKSNLSDSSIKSCLRLCKRYHNYRKK